MELSDARRRALAQRIMLARMRILSDQGFFGLLLMHMRFAIGDELDTAWVSADTITFNPDFMDGLSDDELVFVLEHEVMHAALGHLSRGRDFVNQELFNVACDIVVNSNILHSNGMDVSSITLDSCGESMHLTPGGDEGYNYTAEEVYEMFPPQLREDAATNVVAESGCSRLEGDTSQGGGPCPEGDASQDGGPCTEGNASQGEGSRLDELRGRGRGRRWDWHVMSDESTAEKERDVWEQRLRDARAAIRTRDPENGRGLVPLCAERLIGELDAPRADWRALLGDFVQEEVFDWSFQTPDRRYADGPFIMPGYGDTEPVAHDVMFMVDASGSVTDAELTDAVGEVRGSLEQFAGRLDGWVGFFDADPYEPVRFESAGDVAKIRPVGGGGTRFEAVFEGIEKYLPSDDISCIVILTDGLAPFPEERIARGTPVLWLLTEGGANPPWGRVAHMNEKKGMD